MPITPVRTRTLFPLSALALATTLGLFTGCARGPEPAAVEPEPNVTAAAKTGDESTTPSTPSEPIDPWADVTAEAEKQDAIVADGLPRENFLYQDENAQVMIPETYFELSDEDRAEAEPLFDAVGERAKSHYVKGAILNQRGYGTEALGEFNDAVQADPDNLWLKNRAAQALMMRNDFPRAQKMLEEVLQADPQNYQAMLLQARAALFRDKLEEARTWYLKVLDVKPRNIEALENLARLAYANDNDLEKTKDYCSQILKITSQNYNALLWHAEASALTGDITVAADLYQQLLHYRPALVARLGEMGLKLQRMNRSDDALELFRRGVIMAPDADPIRAEWEDMLNEKGGPDAIVEAYKKLCEEFPVDLDIQELYADFLTRTNRIDDLKSQRERMLEVDPRHIPSLLSLAGVALVEEDKERANEYFERAIAAGPEHPATYREIAEVYIEQGNLERAGELLAEAAAINPEDPDTLRVMAVLAEKHGEKRQAEQLFKKALDAEPANARLLAELGEFYRRNNRTEEAAQLYEQVLAVSPGDRTAQVKLAELLFEMDKGSELDQLQNRAAGAVEDKFGFFVDYGFLATSHGEWNRARWSFEKALQLFPGNLGLRNSLADVYIYLGEKELAEQTMLDGGKDLDPERKEAYQLSLIDLYGNLEMPEKALVIAEEIAAAKPDNFDAQQMVLSLLLQLKRDEEVTKRLNDMMKKFSADNSRDMQILRATVYKERGDLKRAISVLESLLSENKTDIEIMFQLGVYQAEADNIAEAEKYYGRVSDKLKDEKETTGIQINSYNNLAYLYAQKGIKLETAMELVDKALALSPQAGYIMDTKGWILYQKGDLQAAEKMLNKAVKFSHPDAELYVHLGDVYRDMKQAKLARQYYERALAIDSSIAGLREKLDGLNVAMEDAAPQTQ